ncbi:MAG: hypothetical protein AAGG61_01895, partial [Methanothrix soehngenii]|uniref:hypothetical protein n=1 Tax=Methanothrix soehngenii TaxID=2223 RepID=UPI00314166F3
TSPAPENTRPQVPLAVGVLQPQEAHEVWDPIGSSLCCMVELESTTKFSEEPSHKTRSKVMRTSS